MTLHSLDIDMTGETYQPIDRRPLASRDVAFWQKAASRLARIGVSPNAISLAGMVCALGAGVCLALTAHVEDIAARIYFGAAAVGAQLRLIANLLDGMVAIESGKASRVGELYNDVPDRVSDAAILIGAGYAIGGDIPAGFLAACLAIMTAYVRVTGKAAGVLNLYQGPMAKQHRMFVMTLAGCYLAIAPLSWQPIWHGRGVMAGALWLIVVGCVVTIWRRLRIIASHLREKT